MIGTASIKRGTLIALVATLAAAGPTAAAAPKPPPISPGSGGIVVTSSDGSTLTTFRSLKCKFPRRGIFQALGKQGSWRFHAEIYHFSGFHSYDVDYGPDSNADFTTADITGRDTFDNSVQPMTGGSVQLTKGGSIAFPGGRGKLGIAFGVAYDTHDFHSQVSIFGTAKCSYPSKRGKK